MHTQEQKDPILVAVITAFITTFMGSALNLSIPSMGKEFRVSAQEIGWVITVYMLTCCCLAVTFGRMANALDRKQILRTGILIFAAAIRSCRDITEHVGASCISGNAGSRGHP